MLLSVQSGAAIHFLSKCDDWPKQYELSEGFEGHLQRLLRSAGDSSTIHRLRAIPGIQRIIRFVAQEIRKGREEQKTR